jgi:hypothetical protein
MKLRAHRGPLERETSFPAYAKAVYLLPKDDLAAEVLVRSFRVAMQVDCMVGFFASSALAELAPGLATNLNRATGLLRLIVSPFLRDEDVAAIEEGVKSQGEVGVERLGTLLITEDLIEKHTLACLSHLLQRGRIELRIAVMESALFHPKVWLFASGDRTLVVHGSCNMTGSALRRNFEQISVSRSWADPTERYITEKLAYQFERL